MAFLSKIFRIYNEAQHVYHDRSIPYNSYKIILKEIRNNLNKFFNLAVIYCCHVRNILKSIITTYRGKTLTDSDLIHRSITPMKGNFRENR